MKKYYYIIIILIITSCGSSDELKPTGDDFNRGQILEFTYESIIIPAYTNLNSKIDDLQKSVNWFIEDPSEGTLSEMRNAWVSNYKAWQAVAMFNIREAEELQYAAKMNSYPCSESMINQNIDVGINEIGNFTQSMLGTTGFPAIGYMIFGVGGSINNNNANIISIYNDVNNGVKYKQYLAALVQDMKTMTENILTDWLSNKSAFVNSTNNTATSSLNLVVNDFLQYFEKRVREAKVATPSGVRGDLNPLYDHVESYYKSDICKELLKDAFSSVKRVYKGSSFDGLSEGTGLEDYLMYLDNTEELILAIDNQLNIIDDKIELLNDDFIIQMNTNNQAMFDVFYAMQTLVTYTKTDMLSFLNISTDYLDNDGD